MFRILSAALPAFVLVSCATAQPQTAGPAPAQSDVKAHEPHIITIRSNTNFETTLATLTDAINQRGFKTFAVIDHAKGAASIGETLAPTTLIIFGNPKGGTPLLQQDSRIGLEIPLRILVRETDNGVEIIHEDMAHLFHEYGLEGLDKNLAGIEAALASVSAAAAAQN